MTREITYGAAITEGLRQAMALDDRVVLLGEGIGIHGGPFGVTVGLKEEFGEARVIDTPICENGFTGVAIGAAMTGLRPCVELMFVDFALPAMDQIVNQAAKTRYMTGGALQAPVVVRTTIGAYAGAGPQHAQALHAMFAHVPGLKVALPSTPYDAKGLLTQALRLDDPVIFVEHKRLYKAARGAVPLDYYTVPFGRAVVRRAGQHVTIVALSAMNQVALEAAEHLASEDISAEVVDPCTLVPLDEEAILASVRKTAHLVVVDEGHRRCGAARDIEGLVMEQAFEYLDAAPVLVTPPDVPVPFAAPLWETWMPKTADVVAAVRSVLGGTQPYAGKELELTAQR